MHVLIKNLEPCQTLVWMDGVMGMKSDNAPLFEDFQSEWQNDIFFLGRPTRLLLLVFTLTIRLNGSKLLPLPPHIVTFGIKEAIMVHSIIYRPFVGSIGRIELAPKLSLWVYHSHGLNFFLFGRLSIKILRLNFPRAKESIWRVFPALTSRWIVGGLEIRI